MSFSSWSAHSKWYMEGQKEWSLFTLWPFTNHLRGTRFLVFGHPQESLLLVKPTLQWPSVDAATGWREQRTLGVRMGRADFRAGREQNCRWESSLRGGRGGETQGRSRGQGRGPGARAVQRQVIPVWKPSWLSAPQSRLDNSFYLFPHLGKKAPGHLPLNRNNWKTQHWGFLKLYHQEWIWRLDEALHASYTATQSSLSSRPTETASGLFIKIGHWEVQMTSD